MPYYPNEIQYSDKYSDGTYEYRNVTLPKNLFKQVKKLKLMSQSEWRSLGIQGSDGWQHYDWYLPEPHIIMLRKLIK